MTISVPGALEATLAEEIERLVRDYASSSIRYANAQATTAEIMVHIRAHVAAVLAPVIAEQVAAGAAKAVEDAALRVEGLMGRGIISPPNVHRAIRAATRIVREGGRP